jgi:hypothetical protein
MILAELSEIGLLAVTFCLGWFTWSVVIRMTKQHFHCKSLQEVDTTSSVMKTIPKLAENDADDEDIQEPYSSVSPSSLDVQKLLESYNLFGASPGIWSAEFGASDAESEASGDDACDDEYVEVSEPTCYKHMCEVRRDSDVSTTAGSEVDEASDHDSEGADFKGFDDENHSPAALFEQYGLFGAVPGTWKMD